ncbi:hypothetical protein BASA82_001072 [Batrachochytrium salamandrivorans]|nr:hypothetical protein BASA82_001072 [Batrachochytrium salamandrivorans]
MSSSRKSTELAEGIVLYTTDHFSRPSTSSSSGVRSASPTPTIASIEFELHVLKNKLVIFEIDFTGSTNLRLASPAAASSPLKRKTCVEPNNPTQVALVQIADPSKSWSLETKYTWLEENPGTVQPGQSKQERLADGLLLTTTRTAEMFVFHLTVERSSPIRVTLDCSKSENLEMVLGNNQPGVGNVTSVTLPAFSRSLVCSLQVRDLALGYKLKTKWSWSETGLGNNRPPLQPQMEDENLSFVRRKPDAPSFLSLPSPTRAPPPTSSTVAVNNNNKLAVGSGKPPTKVKREEISPQVFLITEISDNVHRCEITYVLQVDKNTRVKFEANFHSSHNLQLTPGGGLVCEATVEPFRKMQVARLESLDSALPWKLQCKYKWQEEDLEKPVVAAPLVTGTSVTTATPSGIYDVRSLLQSLNLEGYADLFVGEELTLDLLKVMVRDESEFRRSLELLGVNKMGHRERMIVALRQLPMTLGGSNGSSSGMEMVLE